MIDTNGKFNAIFITISIIMVAAICYMGFLIVRTENSRIYFNINERKLNFLLLVPKLL